VESSFYDEVRECIDKLYVRTGDEAVRILFYIANKIDASQTPEDRRRALLDFLTVFNFYIWRYGDDEWFREVYTCVMGPVIREAGKLFSG